MTEKSNKVKQKLDKIKLKRSKVKRKHDRNVISEFDQQKLYDDIMKEAKMLRIAESTAEFFAKEAADKVTKWIEKRSAATIDDINRRVSAELAKYNADLAYVYQNRGKII